VFFVEVVQKNGNFLKKTELIQLYNRPVCRKTIILPQEFHSHYKIVQIVESKLQHQFQNLLPTMDPTNRNTPILYLTLKGKKPPSLSEKTLLKHLRREILGHFPVIDVKIYLKFGFQVKTLETYIISRKLGSSRRNTKKKSMYYPITG